MDAKRKRKIWKITAITAGVIIVLVMIALLFLGTIVKHSLTTIGPKVLGAPVKVGSVRSTFFRESLTSATCLSAIRRGINMNVR